MRLTLVPVAAGLLLLPALPMASASAAGGNVRVTAVVRDASGQLSFRHGRALDLWHGRALAARWRGEQGVVAADVAHRIRTTGIPDPLAPVQWALTALRATDVGDAAGQVVGVVDTGVQADHPDLAGVVLPGRDYVEPGGDGRTDPNGHGTHVAGIVAALRDNGIGGAGLAQGAHVLPVRVMAADGSGLDVDAAEGLVWAVQHGATVVNLSFGGPDRSTVMDRAVQYALESGVPVVVAAGNEGALDDPLEWPAATDGVIAVGAVDAAGVRPSWSSTGAHLAVVAPGARITSTVPYSDNPSGYATWDGTSMAAPFVSAAVALLRHAQPTLTPGGVRQRLMVTAADLGPVGIDPQYGAGLVDIVAAESVAAPEPAPDPGVVTPFYTARISTSRTSVPYVGAVTVATRVLAGDVGRSGIPVTLQRLVGTSWVETRVGTSGAGGLTSWVLHPDRTTSYRVVGVGLVSPTLRIPVTPVVSLRVSRTGVAGRVLPAGAAYVRIDDRRGTSWVALTTLRSATDGTFRQTRRLAAGTVLRAVASGVASPAVRVA
ncbi:MAG: S8 family serine peptidase [Frankiaceae bacterium]|nr:S8 family serine peptidase [Frankiaceae bacterium]